MFVAPHIFSPDTFGFQIKKHCSCPLFNFVNYPSSAVISSGLMKYLLTKSTPYLFRAPLRFSLLSLKIRDRRLKNNLFWRFPKLLWSHVTGRLIARGICRRSSKTFCLQLVRMHLGDCTVFCMQHRRWKQWALFRKEVLFSRCLRIQKTFIRPRNHRGT